MTDIYPGMPLDEMPLDLMKDARKRELEDAYESAIERGHPYAGSFVQIDIDSMSRMTSVLSELRAGNAHAHGGFWVLSDNSRVSMDESEATVLLSDAVACRLDIDQHYFSSREYLLEADTVDKVMALVFDF